MDSESESYTAHSMPTVGSISADSLTLGFAGRNDLDVKKLKRPALKN